jgi:hypothetical protein
MPIIDDELAKIIRPIVEGQIRSFIHSHPGIVEGVDWRHSQPTKEEALVASIAKRVNRDLLSEHTRRRLKAVMEVWYCDGEPDVEAEPASEGVEAQLPRQKLICKREVGQ